MEPELVQIAQQGNIIGLYDLIKSNRADFKRIEETLFEETPLHVAAAAGQTKFALEVMNMMPSFARKLNKDGLSPLHLALLNSNTELVCFLVRVDCELVRIKGSGGITPLHYAVQNGDLDFLAIFLASSPTSIEDITFEGDTMLHIAVKNDQLEALQVVVGWFKRICHKDVSIWKRTILKRKDNQGNRALDIALSKQQTEAIKLLAEINGGNSNGLTTVETLQGLLRKSWSFVKILWNACRSSGLDTQTQTLVDYLRSKPNFDEKLAVYISVWKLKMSEDVRNAMLVVAGIIMAATFQAMFNVSGGGFLDNPTVIINGTTVTVTNTTSNAMGKTYFLMYSSTNSIILCSAIVIIGLLLSDVLLGPVLLMMLIYLVFCYGITIYFIAPNLGFAGFSLLLISFLVFMFSIMMLCKQGRRKIKKLRYNAQSITLQ